jgi:hypothetical protein
LKLRMRKPLACAVRLHACLHTTRKALLYTGQAGPHRRRRRRLGGAAHGGGAAGEDSEGSDAEPCGSKRVDAGFVYSTDFFTIQLPSKDSLVEGGVLTIETSRSFLKKMATPFIPLPSNPPFHLSVGREPERPSVIASSNLRLSVSVGLSPPSAGDTFACNPSFELTSEVSVISVSIVTDIVITDIVIVCRGLLVDGFQRCLI